MEKNVICFECGAENEYEFRKVLRKYEGDGYSFKMDVEIPICKCCGATIDVEAIEDEIARKANQKIREIKGIITKDEILNILKKYQVSQKFMSKLLGWGEITLTRYISGGYTPNLENSNKLKELENPYLFWELLEKNVAGSDGQLKEETIYRKAEKATVEEIKKVEEKNGKIYQVVNWYLSQSSEDNPITNLALQKLLYFTQGWGRVLLGKWIFPNTCEAWVHGAVYPQVYHEFKKFRYHPLPILQAGLVWETGLTEAELDVMRNVRDYYFNVYNAKSLEKICHKENPYVLARSGCLETDWCSEKIKKEEIENYYREIVSKFHVSLNDFTGVKKYLYDLIV